MGAVLWIICGVVTSLLGAITRQICMSKLEKLRLAFGAGIFTGGTRCILLGLTFGGFQPSRYESYPRSWGYFTSFWFLILR